MCQEVLSDSSFQRDSLTQFSIQVKATIMYCQWHQTDREETALTIAAGCDDIIASKKWVSFNVEDTVLKSARPNRSSRALEGDSGRWHSLNESFALWQELSCAIRFDGFPVCWMLTNLLRQDQQILATRADTPEGEWPLQERNACMKAISVAVSCTPKNRAFRRSLGYNHFKERNPVLKKYRQRLCMSH